LAAYAFDIAILIAGACRRFRDDFDERFARGDGFSPSSEQSLSSVHLHGRGAHEDADAFIHGALAFFRGASCSIKTRDPALRQNRMIDFAITS
jgi:hypothetical protein